MKEPKLHNPVSNHRHAKEAVGEAAARLIHPGMLVGLGTGSTVAYFLQALGRRVREGLQITAIPSSKQTESWANRVQIPLIDMEEVSFLDIAVDGADEIDAQKRMIKGGGGALLREKIVASSSREMVVIVDAGKCVGRLGQHHPLPVEMIPFGAKATIEKLDRMGYRGQLRLTAAGDHYVTDNGNWIFDIDLMQSHESPNEVEQRIRSVVGIVETGFFFDLASTVMVGFDDGRVEVRS